MRRTGRWEQRFKAVLQHARQLDITWRWSLVHPRVRRASVFGLENRFGHPKTKCWFAAPGSSDGSHGGTYSPTFTHQTRPSNVSLSLDIFNCFDQSTSLGFIIQVSPQKQTKKNKSQPPCFWVVVIRCWWVGGRLRHWTVVSPGWDLKSFQR